MTLQLNLDIHGELIIDNFAGGGGASTGIELALGRRVDMAINHDPDAVAMHTANHPDTKHYCESVWEIDPREITHGRPVGLVWLSPDCKHFSKAKGGKPVEKKIRGLAWVALRWAATVKPRVIMLENVEEFVTWGPLVKDENGNHRPCPKRKGREFNAFVNALRRHGYQVEYKELRACDYGAPTIRKRLFLIARHDGQPIVWPEPTHADPMHAKAKKLKPWRTAAECIDWSLPCPSIFERAKPLADATCRRIAKGIMRYVVNAAEPFIVNTANSKTTGRGPNAWAINEPTRTITSAPGFAVVAPVLTEHANASSPRSMPADEPLRTICAQTKGGHHALVSAFMAKHYGGVVGHSLQGEPLHTVTSSDHNSLVTASLEKINGRIAGLETSNITRIDGSSTRRDDLEAGESGQHATRDKDQSETRREEVKGWLSNGQDGVDGQSIPAIGACGRVERFGQRDTGRNGFEPQGRGKAQQQPEQPRSGNQVGELDSCVRDGIARQGKRCAESVERSEGTEGAGSIILGNWESSWGISNNGFPGHAREVAAFLDTYYGTDQDSRLSDPLHTVTTKDRYGLVTVAGEEYQIADIGLRMLAPRELFNAQGFPANYIIDYGIAPDGSRIALTKTAQVRMCGNSVCPPLAAALVRANVADLSIRRAA